MGSLNISKLSSRLNYKFKSKKYAKKALTHSSVYSDNEVKKSSKLDYERLEFLGDRVLGLVIADLLLNKYPNASEGEIASRFNHLVRRETCAEIAERLELGEFIIFGESEKMAGGKEKTSILADVCESIIASIYKDGGFEVAYNFIKSNWNDNLSKLDEIPKDPKSKLQEWLQAQNISPPTYVETKRSGPDHSPVFIVECRTNDFEPIIGKGGSKKIAEQNAAEAFLKRQKLW